MDGHYCTNCGDFTLERTDRCFECHKIWARSHKIWSRMQERDARAPEKGRPRRDLVIRDPFWDDIPSELSDDTE